MCLHNENCLNLKKKNVNTIFHLRVSISVANKIKLILGRKIIFSFIASWKFPCVSVCRRFEQVTLLDTVSRPGAIYLGAGEPQNIRYGGKQRLFTIHFGGIRHNLYTLQSCCVFTNGKHIDVGLINDILEIQSLYYGILYFQIWDLALKRCLFPRAFCLRFYMGERRVEYITPLRVYST